MSELNYEKLSDRNALKILEEDFGKPLVEKFANQIISASDVLYYADKFGDLESGILLQAWDKSLPERVHKGLLDSGRDIYEAVNCHDLETFRCSSCDEEMWAFEIAEGAGYTSYNWIDGMGNIVRHEKIVSNPDGWYWNADQEDDHATSLCDYCSEDIDRDFPRNLDDSGSVVVHYGETDEVSAFSLAGNIVRWDFEQRMNFRNHESWTDLWKLPGDTVSESGLPAHFAKNNQTEWLEENGWSEVAKDTVKEEMSKWIHAHPRSYSKEFKKIASEWATGEETHPELDFTYVIEFASFGTPSFLVADENRDELIAKIAELIDRRTRQ